LGGKCERKGEKPKRKQTEIPTDKFNKKEIKQRKNQIQIIKPTKK